MLSWERFNLANRKDKSYGWYVAKCLDYIALRKTKCKGDSTRRGLVELDCQSTSWSQWLMIVETYVQQLVIIYNNADFFVSFLNFSLQIKIDVTFFTNCSKSISSTVNTFLTIFYAEFEENLSPLDYFAFILCPFCTMSIFPSVHF